MCCKDIKGCVLWCIYRFHHWFVSSCKEISYLDSGAINLNWLLITQSNMNKKHVTFDWLKKHSFFFLDFGLHSFTLHLGGKERWMNRKKKSIQVRRIGRGKGIRFPFSFQPYISLSSLLPITAKFSSYFLTNQKTKRKDCFPLFFSLWFLISCHFHPLPYPSSQP